MKIELTNLPSYYINLTEDTERDQSMQNLGKSLGLNINRFNAIRDNPPIKGCGLSHYLLLSSIETPSIIFEDDISVTSSFKPFIEIPDNADAVYLGISRFGVIPERSNIGTIDVITYEHVNDDITKINNMCSAHAVLYLTDEYRQAVISQTKICIAKGIAWDIGTAMLHSYFNIYALRNPFFYQVPQEAATLFSL